MYLTGTPLLDGAKVDSIILVAHGAAEVDVDAAVAAARGSGSEATALVSWVSGPVEFAEDREAVAGGRGGC